MFSSCNNSISFRATKMAILSMDSASKLFSVRDTKNLIFKIRTPKLKIQHVAINILKSSLTQNPISHLTSIAHRKYAVIGHLPGQSDLFYEPYFLFLISAK